MDHNPNRADVDDVDEYPAWKATGERALRIRNLSKRHKKLLSMFEADIDDGTPVTTNVGHREAVAALLEYYYENPDLVSDVTGGEFR